MDSEDTTRGSPVVAQLEARSQSESSTVNAGDDVNSQYEHEAYGPAPGEKDWNEFEVSIPPTDPLFPQTWSPLQRCYITAVMALLVLNA